MAPLTRVTGKVFGSTAPANEIGQFGSALAGNPTTTSDVATIQALSAYTNGWGSAVVSSDNFPPMEEVTGVLKTISYQACYSLQAGIPIYDNGTEYGVGDVVKVVTGKQLDFYVSINGTGNIGKGLADTTYWSKAIIVGDREIGVPQITLNLSATLPANCIWLEGATVSRTDYSNLFAIYGTTFGAGDGSTTFKLPDFRDKYICGVVKDAETTGGYVSAALPNLGLSTTSNGAHTHTRGTMNIVGTLDVGYGTGGGSRSGAFYETSTKCNVQAMSVSNGSKRTGFDASRSGAWTGSTSSSGAHTHSITSSNAIVGASTTVKVDGIKVRVYTRYQ